MDGALPGDAKPIDAMSSGVCTSSASCAAATDLGSVSGDTGAGTVTASGYQAAWYKLRVTEDDSGPFGVQMQLTAQLTSPASENYDVFTYVNGGTDVIECNTPTGTASTSGTTDTLTIGAYSVVREAFHQGILPAFAAHWKERTGRDLRFEESYAGSGAQSRAIASGFDAASAPARAK